jgi:FkbM family methyltransferase
MKKWEMPSTQFINTLSQIYHSDSTSFLLGLKHYFRWHWIRRFGHFPREIKFSNSKLWVDRPSGVAALIYFMDTYDYNNMNLIKIMLAKTKATFFDVGANIGSYTMIASEVTDALIYSFEPHPVAYSALIRNIHLNARTNINALQLALGEQEGELFITNNYELSINRILGSDESTTDSLKVNVRTLDSVCREYKTHPWIIKIDVEGYEDRVLRGFLGESGSTGLFIIENGQSPNIQEIARQMDLSGPWYFHFKRRCFSRHPQSRPEDPLYIRTELIDELAKDQYVFHTSR